MPRLRIFSSSSDHLDGFRQMLSHASAIHGDSASSSQKEKKVLDIPWQVAPIDAQMRLFDKDHFLGPTAKDFECAVCHHIVRHASVCPKDTRTLVCQGCWKRLDSAQVDVDTDVFTALCPVCCQTVTPERQVFVDGVVANLRVKCPHTDCEWKDHDFGLQGKALTDHWAQTCKEEFVACESCGSRMRRKHLGDHGCEEGTSKRKRPDGEEDVAVTEKKVVHRSSDEPQRLVFSWQHNIRLSITGKKLEDGLVPTILSMIYDASETGVYMGLVCHPTSGRRDLIAHMHLETGFVKIIWEDEEEKFQFIRGLCLTSEGHLAATSSEQGSLVLLNLRTCQPIYLRRGLTELSTALTGIVEDVLSKSFWILCPPKNMILQVNITDATSKIEILNLKEMLTSCRDDDDEDTQCSIGSYGMTESWDRSGVLLCCKHCPALHRIPFTESKAQLSIHFPTQGITRASHVLPVSDQDFVLVTPEPDRRCVWLSGPTPYRYSIQNIQSFVGSHVIHDDFVTMCCRSDGQQVLLVERDGRLVGGERGERSAPRSPL